MPSSARRWHARTTMASPASAPGAPPVDPREARDVLLRDLGSSSHGLSQREAERRLLQYGRNELVRRGSRQLAARARTPVHPSARAAADGRGAARAGRRHRGPGRRHRGGHPAQRAPGLRAGAAGGGGGRGPAGLPGPARPGRPRRRASPDRGVRARPGRRDDDRRGGPRRGRCPAPRGLARGRSLGAHRRVGHGLPVSRAAGARHAAARLRRPRLQRDVVHRRGRPRGRLRHRHADPARPGGCALRARAGRREPAAGAGAEGRHPDRDRGGRGRERRSSPSAP